MVRPTKRCGLTFVVAASLAATLPQVASAQCENPCSVRVGTLVLSPPRACLELSGAVDDCDCAALVDMTNDCSSDVVLSDGEVATCGIPPRPCDRLPPDETANLRFPLPEPNRDDERRASLVVGGESHELVVNLNAQDPGGCSAGGRPGGSPFGSLAILLALLVGRRPPTR